MSLKEVQTELARELTLRRSVYPKLIQSQKLNATQAKKQFDRLQTAATLLINMTESEFQALLNRSSTDPKKNEPAPDLFSVAPSG